MKKGVFFVSLVLFCSLVSASFDIGNQSHSIATRYVSSEDVRGWINISLDGERGDSLFEDSFGNSITLGELLNLNAATYACEPSDCSFSYSTSAESETKSFNLGSGAKKIIGFKIPNGIISDIDLVNFTIVSDVSESCTNQLGIDFVKNGVKEVMNNRLSASVCSKEYGCFDSSETTYEGELVGEGYYCQEMTLPEAPGFKVGAWIKEQTAFADTNLIISLRYGSGADTGHSCQLPKDSLSGEREISCEIDFPVETENQYLVCVHAEGAGGSYKVRGYSKDTGGCGYKANPGAGAKNFAYQIFFEKKKFDSIGELKISSDILEWNSIKTTIKNYIDTTYGNDCSSSCIIPIEIISGQNQNLEFRELLMQYDMGGLQGITNKFYDLSETPARINADFQKIYLDNASFDVSDTHGNKTFILNFDGDEILSEEIIIQEVPVIDRINPRIVALGIPTTFEVFMGSSSSITQYKWEFGDGQNVTTTINKATHNYATTGEYDLTITTFSSTGVDSSLTFKINVTSPEKAIRSTLQKKTDDLNAIGARIDSYVFKNGLKEILDFGAKENQLLKAEQDFRRESSDAAYRRIMTTLLGIEIPESIRVSKSADSITFYPKKSNIDPNKVKKIGGGSYVPSNEEAYMDAILSWNQGNVNTKISFKEFSVSYGGDFGEPILRGFNMQIDNNADSNVYLIFDEMDNLGFNADYGVKEKTGYSYMELERGSQTIGFYTTENFDFVNVPVFVSPKLSKLSIAGSVDVSGRGFSKWIFFGLIIFALLIAGLITYVIMQEWYKRKYESYLFKNRNDLYNLMIYITDAKKRQISNKDLKSKLKKAGWSSEQMIYALRKFAGKRTGMFEIISIGKKKSNRPKGSIPKTFRRNR